MNRVRIWGSLGRTPWLWSAIILVPLALSGCNNVRRSPLDQSLNSRFNDEQPSLSGDGRWLALVSNRNGTREILVYDLRNNQLVNLPGLNQANTIAESPSLSRTGRYLVYLSSIQGRPDIALYDRFTKKTDLLTLNYRQWVRNPKISPDGRYIVFETAKRGQWDIEILDRGPQIELDIAEGTPVENPPAAP
ncbi:TolB family protein [Synechocystis sp. PCC 7339]|uniref:TolB family protein n=1 Tax=Synechocystis sp. PCC 7339 TaxID=2782213 RepID=UPI001CC0C1F8|nr:biopolymer transporter Tol [Synechocystis sp. PCC 7339]UAJ72786.1 TolB family protein [Synechocystis sp. PCC 7339]